MKTPGAIQSLIQAAGMNLQHRCYVCHALLEAYSTPRGVNPHEKWVCLEHGALAHDNGTFDRVTRANKVAA
jgi:hypothetical protein